MSERIQNIPEEELIRPEVIGSKEFKKKRGHNTEIKLTFARHTQKISAEVANVVRTGISLASISEGGKERARIFGKKRLKEKGRRPDKVYKTSINRTHQTADAILEESGEPQDSQKGDFYGFEGAVWSSDITREYIAIMDAEKEKVMVRKFPGRKYEDLNLDEQEEVAEISEEPALQWYLDFGDKRPDSDTYSPREMAAVVAYKINKLVNMTDWIDNGEKLDILSVGHKTSTEAFLKYCLKGYIGGKEKTGFDELEEIGGSLKIMEAWDLDINNDEKGNKSISLTIEDIDDQYTLDTKALSELAEEGRILLERDKTLLDNLIK